MVRTGRLYNEHILQDETDRPALLMEGVFDTLRYCGDAVASLGKPDQSHLPLLLAAKRPVAVCLDDDAIGWAMGVLLRMQAKPDIGCVQLPSGMDPADMNPQELLDAASQAVKSRRVLVL
jgi:DNA primase